MANFESGKLVSFSRFCWCESSLEVHYCTEDSTVVLFTVHNTGFPRAENRTRAVGKYTNMLDMPHPNQSWRFGHLQVVKICWPERRRGSGEVTNPKPLICEQLI
jgi:hypothetical protein